VGHADLEVDVGEEGVKARFKVLNDPRFIEAIVVGKKFHEVPGIVSRICGPCGLSHTLTSAIAIENALRLDVPEHVRLLREAAILGEVVENHLIHLSLVALPEYFGCRDVFQLARMKPEALRQVFSLRSGISRVVEAIAGRMVHSNAAEVGGFTRTPSREKLERMRDALRGLLKPLAEFAEMLMESEYPELRVDGDLYLCISGGYSFIGDRVILSNGRSFSARDYQHALIEEVLPHSTSKHVTADGLPTYTGARARENLRADRLSEPARRYVKTHDVPLRNPFDNMRAQAVELIHCAHEMIEEIEHAIELPSLAISRTTSEVRAAEGEGIGLSEAPRGLLIHHYKLNREGIVTYANIITPTAINAKHVEVAASELVKRYFYEDAPIGELQHYLEKLVQAYDPCLGCATHSIRITIRGV